MGVRAGGAMAATEGFGECRGDEGPLSEESPWSPGRLGQDKGRGLKEETAAVFQEGSDGDGLGQGRGRRR